MRLYLVRHGETDSNKKRLLQGRSDCELNEYGRELARKTQQGLKDVPFDAAYTSPLKRAKETAQILIGDRDIPLYEDERICEIGFGEYEGLCADRAHYSIPDPKFLSFFFDPPSYVAPPGGETLEQVQHRVGEFLKELYGRKECREQTILISTHGCALRAMLSVIKGLPLAEFWGDGVHKNCAVTIVDVKEGKAQVVEEGKIYYEADDKERA